MNGLNISSDKLDMLGKISVMAENLSGAFSLRVDGSPFAKGSSANVTIMAKKDLPGIDIRVKDGTVGEKIHIPVILTQSGIKDLVYNDFYIGENCDIEIVAGCGIHNHGHEDSAHDGIHSFHKKSYALGIAVTTSEKLHIMYTVVFIKFEIDELGTGAPSGISDLFHSYYSCSSLMSFTILGPRTFSFVLSPFLISILMPSLRPVITCRCS